MPAIDGNTGRLFTDPSADAVQSVRDRLTVPLGSRPHLPAYGSRLNEWGQVTADLMESSIRTALQSEPRVTDVEFQSVGAHLDISIEIMRRFRLQVSA